MLGTAARRLAQMIFVLLGISILVFLIFFATPGAYPASRIAGRNASPETLAAVRAERAVLDETADVSRFFA